MTTINNCLILLTFIPWIAIFLKNIITNLNNPTYQKFLGPKFLPKIFKIFRLDTLLLVLVFFYFSSFDKAFVDKYLFPVICIYLFLNSFYAEKIPQNKNFFQDNWLKLFIILIIMLLPFLIYFIYGNLKLTYQIMLLYLFLEYLIIFFSHSLSILIKKIFRKKRRI